jgi:DNA-binding NtrC family response regulator
MERETMSLSGSASSCFASLPHKSLAAPSVKRDEFGIIGNSAAARRLRLQVRRIGPHFRTVLIRGEAGTEKELIARALHGISQCAGAPFVVCPAAAFDDALSNANVSAGSDDDLGRMMRMSPRGTLFLDEIGEMSLVAQGRLLHLLERHDAAQNRLDVSQRMDLRMIVSTCEDLRVLVSTGHFRQELHQRLATVEITVPPLSERMEDIPELVRYSLERFGLLYGKSVPEVAEDAMERMRRYHWPGNVRELEGVLRNGVLQTEGGPVGLNHLSMPGEQHRTKQSATGASRSVRLQDVVEQHVLCVLKDCGGNKLRAAEALGISRSTLYRMLDAGTANGLRRGATC